MGVRCFWPHNTIGLEGLVINTKIAVARILGDAKSLRR